MLLKITIKQLLLPLLCIVCTAMAGKAQIQGEREDVSRYRHVYTFQPPSTGTPAEADTGRLIRYVRTGNDSAGISVIYPPRLQEMLDMHARKNFLDEDADGYRIQIYAGSKLEHANEAKADFLAAFAEYDFAIYQKWHPPHFRVRVGDFLSRSDALREMAMVRQIFPDAFIVPDVVKLPKYKKHVRKDDEHVDGELEELHNDDAHYRQD